MKRKNYLFLTLLFALPITVNALGLGQLELNSGLNQPFEARIELLSTTAGELLSLNVGLADIEAFQRSGIDRLFILSKLRFEIHDTDSGSDYIRVYSVDPIREPYLNFLVEASWSNGRLLREFTVLLDPPLYDPNARRAVIIAPDIEDYEAIIEPEDEYVSDSFETEEFVTTGSEDDSEVYTGGDYILGEYGPTVSSDTLWSISSATRPDSSISIQQMMLAIQRANADAFLDDNINGLKRGQILRIPDRNEILVLTQAEALAEVRSQYSIWDETRGAFATSTPTRPISASFDDDITETTDSGFVEDSSELRLVAASETGISTDQGGDSTGITTADTKETNEALSLANEQLEAISQENLDLKDRLSEAEGIIEDLERLISLQDDDLASLQQQAAISDEAVEELALLEEDIFPEEVEGDLESDIGIIDEGEFDEEIIDDEVVDEETIAESDEEEISTVQVSEPIEAPKGLVDKVISVVMDNIIIVAGALAVIVLVIAGFIFISRRKSKEVDTGSKQTEAPSQFPDFSSSEDETIIPGDDSEDINAESATVIPEGTVGVEAEADVDVAKEELAPTVEPEPEPEVEEPEEDPLAEVNVFLAYEHFDQAEEFVRDAISNDPDNLECHTKLLEIFYASGDKAKYEEAAKLLHEKVNGEGSYWDMAVAMWSEMSPNRALFEAGGDEEEATTADTAAGGGVLDLTAEDTDQAGGGAVSDMDLDFDLGDAADAPAEPAEGDESVLDLTAAVSTSDLGNDDQGEDLLDVTAAVGLEPELGSKAEPVQAQENEVLDITAGSDEVAENLLDVSSQGGENLLDVTSQSNMESVEGEEDLLDVTAATGADELLEISDEVTASDEDDNSLDFDIGGIEVEPATKEEDSLEFDIGGLEEETVAEDNVIEFDAAASGHENVEEEGLEISLHDEVDEEAGIELEVGLKSGEGVDESEVEIGLSMDKEAVDSEAETVEVKLEDYQADLEEEQSEEVSDGLEIDLSFDDSAGAETVLEIEAGEQDEAGVELDLTIDDSAGDSSKDEAMEISMVELDSDQIETADDDGKDLGLELDVGEDTVVEQDEIDLEATVQIPEIDLNFNDDDDDDDDDDHTVFVPRSADAEEQTEEDEVATKLDLAKAYVELGDKDSAKGILEEIIKEGNEQQRKLAQDLLNQVG